MVDGVVHAPAGGVARAPAASPGLHADEVGVAVMTARSAQHAAVEERLAEFRGREERAQAHDGVMHAARSAARCEVANAEPLLRELHDADQRALPAVEAGPERFVNSGGPLPQVATERIGRSRDLTHALWIESRGGQIRCSAAIRYTKGVHVTPRLSLGSRDSRPSSIFRR
jgi:hypothetical protein